MRQRRMPAPEKQVATVQCTLLFQLKPCAATHRKIACCAQGPQGRATSFILSIMKEPPLPELAELERLIADYPRQLTVQTTCEVTAGAHRFPVYALTLGARQPEAPAVGFFGGVHGLERIGTRVLLSFLRGLLSRLRWDGVLLRELESVRLVFMPLVNPAGMWRSTRSNLRGVDLMRNAPVESAARVSFMVGGQRISPLLPWYRGACEGTMEAESAALCRVVREQLLPSGFSVALDCHSGFGLRDRIWFPYAHTTTPIRHLPEIAALEELFSQACPNHPYLFEPQSRKYLTHGDLWDYLYQQASADEQRIFLPLTLEMGSWNWVRKSPRQLLSWQGLFNPLPPHRLQRVMRRHLAWLEFLARAACGYRQWLPDTGERRRHEQLALSRWYRGTAR